MKRGHEQKATAFGGLTTDMRRLPLAIRLTPPIKLAIHGAIYRWAASAAAGHCVLDLGCAEGHGSRILAETAREVVGVDWDADLINEAAQLERSVNVKFLVGDCTKALFRRGSFNLVVNSAVLEHVDDPKALMTASVAALGPNGIMVCGTKNSDACLKGEDGAPLYGNHANEYSEASLRTLLSSYFERVEMYHLIPDQDAERFLDNRAALGAERVLVRLGVKELIPRRFRNWVRGIVTGTNLQKLSHKQFAIYPAGFPGDVGAAHYVLAVASQPRPVE